MREFAGAMSGVLVVCLGILALAFGRVWWSERDVRREPADLVPPGIGTVRESWLAISSLDTKEILRQLGLDRARSIGWPVGLARARTWGTVAFVTPGLDGWTLVLGSVVVISPERVAELGLAMGCEVRHYAFDMKHERLEWSRASGGKLDAAAFEGDACIMQIGDVTGLQADDDDDDALLRVAGGLESYFRALVALDGVVPWLLAGRRTQTGLLARATNWRAAART